MKRYRHWLVVAAAAAIAVPGGVAAAQAVSGGQDRGIVAAGPAPGTVDLEDAEPLSAATIEEVKKGYAFLSTCPEVLAFFQTPEVKEFFEENFGEIDENSSFGEKCPELEDMKSMYETTRERVEREQGAGR